jgi:hypothetical protein
MVDGLRRSGQAARDAATVTSGVDLHAAITLVSGAIEGSTAATLAGQIGLIWRDRLRAWQTDIGLHGGGLIQAAAGYAAADEETSASISQAPGWS